MQAGDFMNLFTQLDATPTHEELFPGAILMRGLALAEDQALLAAVEGVASGVPFRPMTTPTGLPMSIVSTACGTHPRLEENIGFRYGREDGLPNRPRPKIPEVLLNFALRAARLAGFSEFHPDACLMNRYQAGTKLGLHQDRHEFDLAQPIVSVSFGLQATFLFGGFARTSETRRILLEHGDVIVWGGPSRLRFHGILPLRPGHHPLTGPYRYNLTFRKVA